MSSIGITKKEGAHSPPGLHVHKSPVTLSRIGLVTQSILYDVGGQVQHSELGIFATLMITVRRIQMPLRIRRFFFIFLSYTNKQ